MQKGSHICIRVCSFDSRRRISSKPPVNQWFNQSRKYSAADCQANQVDINNNAHPFYNYKSGRWL